MGANPLPEYAAFQSKWERDLRRALSDAGRLAEREILRGPFRAEFTREIARESVGAAFEDMTARIRSGRTAIAGLAGSLAAEDEARIFREAGVPKGMIDAYVTAQRTQAAAQIDAALTRITTSYIPLSEQVYKTHALASGLVDRRVNAMLASGASPRELARSVRGLIDPNTRGGASYAALRLGRTEINNAAHASALARMRGKPWVRTVDWNLSGSHPRDDICDDLERASPYTPESVPEKPHPQCLCTITATPISDDEFIDGLFGGDFDYYIDSVMEESGYTRAMIEASRLPAPPVSAPSPVGRSSAQRIDEAKADGGPMNALPALGRDIDDIIARSLAEASADRSLAAARLDANINGAIKRSEKEIEEAFPKKADADVYRAAIQGRAKSNYAARIEHDNADGFIRDRQREVAQRIVNQGRVNIAVKEDALEAILRDGRIKSQFETGTSGGAVGPTARRFRAEAETAMLDIHPSVAASRRPVYGYATTGDNLYSGGVNQYGRIRIEIHESVRERTTFTIGDSLGAQPKPIRMARAEAVTEQEAFAAQGIGPSQSSALRRATVEDSVNFIERRKYFEAQIEGGVSVSEFKAVHLPLDQAYDRFLPELERLGIRVERYG